MQIIYKQFIICIHSCFLLCKFIYIFGKALTALRRILGGISIEEYLEVFLRTILFDFSIVGYLEVENTMSKNCIVIYQCSFSSSWVIIHLLLFYIFRLTSVLYFPMLSENRLKPPDRISRRAIIFSDNIS